jgi:hypothetical protein
MLPIALCARAAFGTCVRAAAPPPMAHEGVCDLLLVKVAWPHLVHTYNGIQCYPLLSELMPPMAHEGVCDLLLVQVAWPHLVHTYNGIQCYPLLSELMPPMARACVSDLLLVQVARGRLAAHGTRLCVRLAHTMAYNADHCFVYKWRIPHLWKGGGDLTNSSSAQFVTSSVCPAISHACVCHLLYVQIQTSGAGPPRLAAHCLVYKWRGRLARRRLAWPGRTWYIRAMAYKAGHCSVYKWRIPQLWKGGGD